MVFAAGDILTEITLPLSQKLVSFLQNTRDQNLWMDINPYAIWQIHDDEEKRTMCNPLGVLGIWCE